VGSERARVQGRVERERLRRRVAEDHGREVSRDGDARVGKRVAVHRRGDGGAMHGVVPIARVKDEAGLRSIDAAAQQDRAR
jgi:hypothetical protein